MLRKLPWLAVGLTLVTSSCASSSTPSPSASNSDSGPTDGGVAEASTGSGILFTVSGEDYAATGFDFVPGTSRAHADPPAFADGWAIRFERVLVTIGNLRIHGSPDLDADPTRLGALVAEDPAMYAVDLVRGGDIVGKSGSAQERTVAIARMESEVAGTALFVPDQRYAFSFDTIAASAAARRVNLDAAANELYEHAIAKGYASVYVGTATYKGPAPDPASIFGKMPTTVHFTLGFANPTSHINCRNPDLARGDDGYPRGIPIAAHAWVTAQITMHVDHAFAHRLNDDDPALVFDAIAASSPAFGVAKEGSVTIDDLADVDIAGVRARNGEVLPRRSHVPDYLGNGTTDPLSLDANGVTFTRPRSLASYLSYAATNAGHLNGFGACVVRRNFVP